jgi:hypothetical protein
MDDLGGGGGDEGGGGNFWPEPFVST